jgi:hypothetical protein
MLYIDHKFVNLLSNRLDRFKRSSPTLYNFRCPICGDSQKNKHKTRGYIFEKQNKLIFHCHNCNASMIFGKFLEWIDPQLYKEYKTEKYLEKQVQQPAKPDITKIERPRYLKGSPLRSLKKISQLPHDHPAKLYVVHRRIPPEVQYKLFYCPRFKQWVNSFIPEKFSTEDGDEPRLILPFLDKEGECFGFQGRSFKKDGIRYITIILDDSKPKIFGLDTIDFTKTFYIVEGPIDSLFLDNAVAMAGADLGIDKICGQDLALQNCVYVYDNEPRNVQIVKKMEQIVNRGYNIVIWPSSIEGVKDINDMVLEGYDPKGMVKEFQFKGLEARLKFVEWKKV